MYPGQLLSPGQVSASWVNFASVYGVTSATVRMSFHCPGLNLERRITRLYNTGNPPCRDNFSPCEQNAKIAPGQE